MNTELEVLKKIFQGKEKTPLKSISSHLGYGIDYIRFICKKLEERNLIKELSRDWYKITAKGQKELERIGLVKRSLRKRLRPSHHPPRGPLGFKIESPVWDRVQIPVIHPSKTVKLKSKLEEPKAEKLKLGKRIEKTAISLKNLTKTY